MNATETLIIALERTNERLKERKDFARYGTVVVANRVLIEELRHELSMQGV